MRIDIKNGLIQTHNGDMVGFDKICNSINPKQNDIVYLGGSLIEGMVGKYAEGMGNKYSDLDVFIIREENDFISTSAVYSDSVRKTYFIDDFPIGIDIEVFNKKYIYMLSKAIGISKISTDRRIANIFKETLSNGDDLTFINSFLNRFFNSICIFNETEYTEIKTYINFEKFLEIMATYTITEIDNAYSDVIGNIDANQIDVALLCMREIIYLVMSVTLNLNGISVDRKKWIYLKFRNMCKVNGKFRELDETYTSLFRRDIVSDKVCEQVIKDALKISRQTIENIIVGGLEL